MTIVAAVSSRIRLYAVVAAAALAAAGATVGITLATRTTIPKTETTAQREGFPPLVLELGVRTDAVARDLRRAAELYDEGDVREAGRLFRRHPETVEAGVGLALTKWPDGFGDLRALVRAYPARALTQLHYGLGLFWRGEVAPARGAWRLARTREPDSPYAIRATDLLFPNFPRGIPIFVPSFPSPADLQRLAPPAQLALLERRARTGSADDKLLFGVALQRLGHRLSARRQFEAAAAVAAGNPEAQVAVAVAHFDKARPAAAFSRLGPLSRRYPRSQSVRFHLGLLLLWLGDVDEAERQLSRAIAIAPETQLATESKRFLDRLETVRTG